MKQITILILSAALVLSLCSCGQKEPAFDATAEISTPATESNSTSAPVTPDDTAISSELAKEIFQELNSTYEVLDDYADDFCNAWNVSIFNESEIREKGFSYFASKISLNEEELQQGIARTIAATKREDWDSLPADVQAVYLSDPDAYLTRVSGKLITFCVYAVIYSYEANGTSEKIESTLQNVKSQLKELELLAPDSQEYALLKAYYMEIRSHYDFFQKPDGTYETLQETTSNYENTIRMLQNELDFIFD